MADRQIPSDMMLASGLPAIPGTLWAMLSRISWADPELVRAHAISLETTLLDGAVGGIGATPVVGTPIPALAAVVAHKYFLVEWIEGYVLADPNSVLEDTLAEYVNVQLADTERRYEYGRAAFNMGPVAGTKFRPGRPLRFDARPLTFLPSADILATFTPLAGFPAAQVHSITQLSTRTVGLTLHGLLVQKDVVENLLDGNREVMNKFGLLRRAQ